MFSLFINFTDQHFIGNGITSSKKTNSHADAASDTASETESETESEADSETGQDLSLNQLYRGFKLPLTYLDSTKVFIHGLVGRMQELQIIG